MNAIETTGLTRRFWRHTAVDHIDLTVPTGTVNVLIGANGAGKTTLLKTMLNLLPPSAGHARVLGTDSRRLAPAELRRIGYVSENQKPPDHLTVAGLMAYWRPLYPQWDRTLEAKLLRNFDLPLDRKLGQLSRGMAMKAALASVLAYRPELLVLDEPFSGLDPLTRDQLVEGMLDLVSREGCTVLVSSHEIAEVETLADRLILLDHGHLKLTETADALRARFRQVEVSGTSVSVPARVWQMKREGTFTRYIDPQFDLHTTPAGARVTPLPLREIFIALLRQHSTTRPTGAIAS
ncbi:ABC transporter ATP-binding protein [Synoicihabitans lomoniglobus]|uniref:ABC transporter ATP-binding protein n=1 Tax=Synoicihabitans lomoniglobus TaxID=2909285 RepID=A0AAF0CNP9_9BACT|nr:ABC transporter ATP-binding protein [Opitutaceae bacterium LMO-M01]WED64806.1 ABC transporter ATP-binding protein [Opitutaceae bacterium LMO-M01]